MSIPVRLLMNTVVLEKRSVSFNAVNEEVESFSGTEELPASVQDRTAQELRVPDIDGPVILDTTIFTDYRTDIEHLDRLRQTDVSPEKLYRVIFPDDAAGRHHHLEIQCERILVLDEAS